MVSSFKSFILYIFSLLNKYSLYLILPLLFLEILPYLYLGENIKVHAYDFLDGAYANSHLIIKYKSDILTKFNFWVPEFMNGQSFNSIWAVKSIHFIWIWLFGPFYGYVVSKFVMMAIAFIGFYLFSLRYFGENNEAIAIWGGYFYATTNFWGYDLSQAFIPFMFYIFFSLRSIKGLKNNIINYLLLVFFGFYSSLILSGFFVLVVLFCIELNRILKTKIISFQVIYGFVIISLSYLISHYSLFDEYLFHPILNNRKSFVYDYYNIETAFSRTISSLKYGIFTASGYHVFIILFSILVLGLMLIKRNISKNFILISCYLIFSCSVYGFICFDYFKSFHQFWVSLIPMDLTRFIFLNEFFWILLFCVGLHYFMKYNLFLTILAWLAIFIQLYFVLNTNIWRIQDWFSCSIQEYYAKDLFNKIKKDIKAPISDVTTISLGFPPAVSLYNGFYCLDGYSSTYTLQHKMLFNEIFKKELDKNPALIPMSKENKCYALSAELGTEFVFSPSNSIEIQHLDYNISILKKLKCKYLFSTVKINTQNNPHFKLIKLYTDKDSYWEIYVYQIV